MTVLASRGSGTPVTSGTTWTTTTNVYDGAPGTTPNTNAVWTSSTSGATAYIECTGYSFTAIPGTATLNTVTFNVRHTVSNTTRIASGFAQVYDGATLIGAQQALVVNTTVAQTATFTRTLTLAQLKSASLKVRVSFTRAAVTQSATASVDYTDISADYTPLPSTITGTAAIALDMSVAIVGTVVVPATITGTSAVALGVLIDALGTSFVPAISPIPTTGLNLWLDADDASTFTYSSGSLVSQWSDKSGVGNHAVQATVGRQPSRNGLRNGRTTVMFDGSRAVTATPSIPVSSTTYEFTFFVVVIKTGEPMTYESMFDMCDSYAGRWWSAYNTDRSGVSFYGGSGSPPDYRTAFPDLSIYRVRVDRGTAAPVLEVKAEEAINGIVKHSTVAGNSTTWDTTNQKLWVGARGDYGTFLRGEIGEVIVYDRYLDSGEVWQVEEYLAEKWNTPLPPIPLGGLNGWWDADDSSTITASGGAISQWNDKSGGDRHVTQPTAGLQPTTGIATLNGRNVLVFDDDYIKYETGSPLMGTAASSVFMVFKETTEVVDAGVFLAFYAGGGHSDWDSHSGYGCTTGSSGQIVATVRGYAGASFSGTGASPWGVYSALFRPDGTNDAYKDGLIGTSTTGGTGFGSTCSGFSFGARYLVNVFTPNFKGQIAEVIVYNRVLSTIEREQVEEYLTIKWLAPAGPTIVTGTASVTIDVQLNTVGTVVVVPVITGTSVLALSVTSTTTGTRLVRGSSAVALTLATTVTGIRVVRGTSVVPVSINVITTGTVIAEIVTGTSVLQLDIQVDAIGTGLGAPVIAGTAAVSVSINTVAIGTTVGAVTGTSLIALSLVTTAIGKRIVLGTSAKAISVNIVAVGSPITIGVGGMWGTLVFVEMQYESTPVVDWSMLGV